MPKTLVINPPFLEPHRPPISCAIIGEVARLAGQEVTAIDINIDLFQKVGADQFMIYQNDYLFKDESTNNEFLKNFVLGCLEPEFLEKFDWILVSCFSDWEYKMTAMIVEHCKQSCSAKIVIGGPGVQVNGKDLLEQGHVDYWVVGEGEIALKELFAGNDQYPGINGRAAVQIDDIESLPLPNYDFFDLNKYDWLLDSPDVFIYGSRGCVRKCTFCDVEQYWPKFRWRTGNGIADEMIMNYEKYGVKNFFFADSLLNGNLKEFRMFLDRLSKFDDAKKFYWGGYAIVRPKNQHPAELFDQIQAAGGKYMSIGVETGVDRIRLDMKKHFFNTDIDWHLEQSQRIKLQNTFLMISTWVDETLEEHNEYLKIFKRWQNYAADGTILGINVNSSLAVIDGSPLAEQNLLTRDPELSYPDLSLSLKQLTWTNPTLPELTFVERQRRTLAIINEAVKCNWNIVNKSIKLNEIKSVIQNYSEHKKKHYPTIKLISLNDRA